MSISWASARALSPAEAIEVLRREHLPYVPQVVSVLDDAVDAVWRDPTFDEQVESEVWCDGCNRAADRCSVATILQLVDVRPWWRRLLRSSPAGPSCPTAETPVAEARSHRVIWLGEQECFSWGVTAWAAVAAAVLVGWVVRVRTRNRVPRSS